jgi:hypothetical protein
MCGTCHDVSNPAFEKNASGNYVANAPNTSATNFSAHSLVPVERTYSEWLNSDYNTQAGVVAPAFAGNAPGGVVRRAGWASSTPANRPKPQRGSRRFTGPARPR